MTHVNQPSVTENNNANNFSWIIRADAAKGSSALDGPRSVAALDGPRSVAALDGSRPVAAFDGPRPAAALDGSRSVAALDGPRPAAALDGSRPAAPLATLSRYGACRFVVCRPVDNSGALVTADQLAAARRLLVGRAVAWLAISDKAEAQWMGSKTDLIEIVRYVYEAQVVRTPDGRPLSFLRLAVLYFAKLHTFFCKESFYCLYRQAMRRKGLCMPTMLWRFAWRMNVDRTTDPLAGLIRLLRDPSDGGSAPSAPATPSVAAFAQGVN